jgi:hypothetical protein
MAIPDYGKYFRFGTHIQRGIHGPNANMRFDEPLSVDGISKTGYDMTRSNSTGSGPDTMENAKGLITPPELIIGQSTVSVSDKFTGAKNTTEDHPLTDTTTKVATEMLDESKTVIQNLAEVECTVADRSVTYNGTPAVTAMSTSLAASSKLIAVADPKKPFRLYRTTTKQPRTTVGLGTRGYWIQSDGSHWENKIGNGSLSFNISGTVAPAFPYPTGADPLKKYLLRVYTDVQMYILPWGGFDWAPYSPSTSTTYTGTTSVLGGSKTSSGDSNSTSAYYGHTWCAAGHDGWNWVSDGSRSFGETCSEIAWDGTIPDMSYSASGTATVAGGYPDLYWGISWSAAFIGELIEIG